LNKALRLGVSAILLSWVAWRTDWTKVGEAFAQFRLELWLAAIGTLAITQIVSALRWQMLARPLGFERSLWQYTGFYFIGMYFNLLLPTSVGGDVVRAWYLDDRSGRRLAAFVAVFLDRLSGLLMLLALACVAVALRPKNLLLPAWIPWTVWGTAGGIVSGLALLPLLARRSQRARLRARQLRSVFDTLRSPRLLAATTLLSLVVQAANVLIVWLVGTAIGAQVPGAYYWIVVPMISLLTLLPISVNGMGLRENGMAVFLAPLGIGEGTALTLSLLWFAVVSATSLAGGLVYHFGRFPRPETPADLADEVQTDEGPIGGDPDQGRTGQSKAAA
jgi:glycosyltransferase 2 family protein